MQQALCFTHKQQLLTRCQSRTVCTLFCHQKHVYIQVLWHHTMLMNFPTAAEPKKHKQLCLRAESGVLGLTLPCLCSFRYRARVPPKRTAVVLTPPQPPQVPSHLQQLQQEGMANRGPLRQPPTPTLHTRIQQALTTVSRAIQGMGLRAVMLTGRAPAVAPLARSRQLQVTVLRSQQAVITVLQL